MLRFVIKQLLATKTVSLLTILSLSTAIAVIIVLFSFEQGQYVQLKQASINRGSDLIAVQANIRNFIATRSFLPQMVREKIESVPGVLASHPVTTLSVILKLSGKQTPVYVLVYDTAGGPAKLVEGNVEKSGNGIVIDQSLAKKYSLHINDELKILNYRFVITGITQEAAFLTPFAFINYDGLIDMFMSSDVLSDISKFPLLSYILIDVSDQAALEQVRGRLEEQIPSIDVYRPNELADNDEELGKTFYKPVLGMLIVVGFVLGLVLISLLMHSEVTRHSRTFSVMLALGFTASSLLQYTLYLSLLILIFALVFGLAIAIIVTDIIQIQRPVYYFEIFDPYLLAGVASMVLVFVILGALVPYIAIRKCNPVIALQRSF